MLFHLGRRCLCRLTLDADATRVVRLAEDRTLADIDDATVDLSACGGGATLSIVQPAYLDVGTKARWIELLSSYRAVGALASLDETADRAFTGSSSLG